MQYSVRSKLLFHSEHSLRSENNILRSKKGSPEVYRKFIERNPTRENNWQHKTKRKTSTCFRKACDLDISSPSLEGGLLENFVVNTLILDKSAVCAVQLDIVLNFTSGLLLHLSTKSLKMRRDLLLQRPKIVLKLILRKSVSKPFRSLLTNV